MVEESNLPLEKIVYQRTANQIDDRKGKLEYRKLTFYIREIDRQREFYSQGIKKRNKLYVIGIWDWVTNSSNNLPAEFAFSSAPKNGRPSDQAEMFRVVFENLVQIEERKRFVKIIKRIIKDYGEQLKLKKEVDS